MSASIWEPGANLVVVDAESTNLSQVFIATLAQTVFTLTEFSYTVNTGSLAVYRGGQRLILGSDWEETSGTSITLLGISLEAGEVIEVVAVLGSASVSAIAAAASAAAAAQSAAAAAQSAASINPSAFQPASANLDEYAAVNPTAAGLALLDDADTSAQRTTLGLGSAATLTAGTAANNVVQLDGASKLPAVDGSQLTNLPAASSPSVRQTALFGKVDSNGFAAFGGSTGSTAVTTAADSAIIATAAFGNANRISSAQNSLSFTGLSTNGTMYLYVDVAAGGTVTTGSTTLAPVYQWGGTYSTTNKQFTFNIQEMTGKVGNGSTASQVYRAFVGEVTVAGAVVTAITWYALMGRYESAWTNILPAASTTVSGTHKIGTTPKNALMVIECITAAEGYAVGDQVPWDTFGGAYTRNSMNPMRNKAVVSFTTASTTAWGGINGTGGVSGITAANWKYRFEAERGW